MVVAAAGATVGEDVSVRPENGRSSKPDVHGEPDTVLLLKRVLHAHQEAPLAEMERLITLAREDESLRAQILEGTAEVLADDPDSLAPCWLALIAGELGPPGRLLLLSAVGTSEGEALDEAILPVLARHASEIFDRVAQALEADSDDTVYRKALYTILLPLALSDDGALKERLHDLAVRRVEAEQDAPDGLVSEPFLILAALGSPETTGLLAQARARRQPGDARDHELEALAAGLGSADLLQVPRTTLATGWRDTALAVQGLFGTAGKGS